ncbi:CUB and sushi domain-containing protein 3-like [Branchiostoma floridae]|uniref:CUB and sushi domain-containing protein 3-like n=1 Tax=Branchiostoma floridae TaxID=7739 RepID=A0A9J7LWV3_BRAFL|nr:CUB and sushi domain-containing protein 3-like [Branchiostoma floridae]
MLCPTLTPPENGEVFGSNFYEDQATFQCYIGYNVAGTNPITCQADGTWDAAFPTCEVVQCPTLTAPTNGGVTGQDSYTDIAIFTCNSGYNLVGSFTARCQADGNWDQVFPTCAGVPCDPLTSPTNGWVSETNSNNYPNVATYYCNTGYNVAGTNPINCQTDGTWDAAFPTCAAVQCPALTAPTNGAVSGTNDYNVIAIFTCDPGYNLVGNSAVRCLETGNWDAAFPTCSAGLCPTLPNPTNGAVSGSNSLGDVATFTCNTGYNLVGGSTRTCQTDLTWSGSSPTCTAVQCPVLSAPANGGVSGGNSYGNVATFTCDSGYSLSGSATRTCQADTTWSTASPTCEAGLCPTLPNPTNGVVSGTNSLGDVATFTCNSGYNLVGGSTRTCQTDLTWSGSSPTCNAVQCPALTAPTNGGVSGGNSYGDVATFTCDSGYSLSGSATLTCQADTTWSAASPTCAAGLCPVLTPPTNGAVSGSNSLGDVATFTCNSGYNLVGGSTRTCQTDLTWSGSSPTCTAVQCPALTAPTNGGVSGGNSYGSMATFTCDAGYSLSGSATLTCQADTTWSAASPTCTIGQCPAATAPTNGAVTGSNSFGDTITFTCDPGYNMAGPSTLTCQSNLAWDGSPPTCSAGQCPAPTPPTNGGVTGTYSLGDTVTFTCNTGYNMAGSSTLTCQTDLTWGGSPPTCTAVQCPALTAPTNGGVSGGNSFGNVATFTCDSGYNLAGSATLTCQADATWSTASPTCAIGQCPAPPAPTNGAVTGTNSFGDTITFTCDTGYNMAGPSTLTCQSSLTWDGSPPTCTSTRFVFWTCFIHDFVKW